jgi:hypothetical protein
MFEISKLKRRVKALEEKIASMEQVKFCAEGKHDWEMVESGLGKTPWIRCSACYVTPENKI